MDTEKIIREYLPQIVHMTIATCVDNKPWASEVHFVYDDELNLYWRSKTERRHSLEIARNPNVAGTIVKQYGVEDKPRGLYFEGTAAIFDGISLDHPVYKLFEERLGATPDIVEESYKPDGHRFYKITVSDWYVFDAQETSPGKKYHLPRG